MGKLKIKTNTKKLPGGMKFVSYSYKGEKYNTKEEIAEAVQRGKYGRSLYNKYNGKNPRLIV